MHPRTTHPMPSVGLVDVAEVARRFRVSPRWVRSAAADGRIPYYRVGKFIRFDPGDVEQYLSESRVTGGAQ